MVDFDRLSSDPMTIKGDLLIYSNGMTFWGYWKKRHIILQNGLFSIFECQHLHEKESFYLTYYRLSYENISTWMDEKDTIKYQLCLKYHPINRRKSVGGAVNEIGSPKSTNTGSGCYYLCFNSESEMKMWYGKITDHINYANIVYGISIDEAYANTTANIFDSSTISKESITIQDSIFVDNHSTTLASNTILSDNQSTVTNLQPPDPMRGWLYKRGQVIPSWRRRYFILEGGVLTYYIGHTKTKPYQGVTQKGTMKLWNFMTSLSSEPGKIYLSTDSVSDPIGTSGSTPYVILLYAEDERKNKVWAHALHIHIQYGKFLVKRHRRSLVLSYRLNSNPIPTTTDSDHNETMTQQSVDMSLAIQDDDRDHDHENENEVEGEIEGENETENSIDMTETNEEINSESDMYSDIDIDEYDILASKSMDKERTSPMTIPKRKSKRRSSIKTTITELNVKNDGETTRAIEDSQLIEELIANCSLTESV